ncbi:MAG: 3-hydroxybutyryl-CoA dehydrogenase [Polyangiales bacterium]
MGTHEANGSETGIQFRTIAVVGCGLMGCGIAEVAALAGFDVVAIKATPGDLRSVSTRIGRSLDQAVKKGRMDGARRDAALARVRVSRNMGDLEEADLVIETTVENAAQKKHLLSQIESVVGPRTLIASNTSSLRLDELASALVDRTRFLTLHFFSPVPAMKLVEVAALPGTPQFVIDRGLKFVEALGKQPIRVAPTPGFVVNRLLVPLLLHAIDSLESGVASGPDIDAAMQLGCGHPMGPLALCDLIGLDVVLTMAKTLSSELADVRYRPPTLLRRLVMEGSLGRKTKTGFYDYSGPVPAFNDSVLRWVTPIETADGGRLSIASVA